MLDHEYRHFVSLLDSKRYLMSPAGTMQKNLRWSLTAILGQQHERNFSSCREIFSHAWSDVAFDLTGRTVLLAEFAKRREGRRVIEYLHRR